MSNTATVAVLVGLIIGKIALGAPAQRAEIPSPTRIAAVNDAQKDAFIRLAMASDGLPGLQSVVVKGGTVVWSKSYGAAVLPTPGPMRPMADDSVLFTASMGKLLVAIAVLQQVEQGKLQLDGDIGGYVGFPVRNPAWPDVPITLRMLLTHTSSLEEEDDARSSATYAYGTDAKDRLEEYVRESFAPGGSRHWQGQWRTGKPGTERIYSGDAFDLLAVAVARATGETFDRYVDRAIVKPLGMVSTSYWLAGTPVERFAVGYTSVRQASGTYIVTPAKSYWAHTPAGESVRAQQVTCIDYPSGCAHSNARDFAQLMRMLTSGGTVDGVRILAASSVSLITKPSGFRNRDGWNQGLGVNGPLGLRGQQFWGHDGVDRGAVTAFYFNPKTGVGAITMANANDPDFSLGYGVTDIALHLISWFE